MPSRESVSEAIRARTEFTAAVRTGIDALMGRCGYSRERATLALLKELNRGSGPDCKPTDDEIFDIMRRHKLGLDEANRAIVVSRAMRRELLNQGDKRSSSRRLTPTEAIQKLTSRLSLDNILYESGEDDSDDDGQNEILPLKIPKVSRVSSPINVSTSSTNSNTKNHSGNIRKNNRSKKNTSSSPRKQLKVNHIRNKVNANNNASNTSNTIIVGRKRSIESMDGMDSTKQHVEVEAKAATSRSQLRPSKRMHRSSASTDSAVASNK